jgi:hypothetical protein
MVATAGPLDVLWLYLRYLESTKPNERAELNQ